MGRKKLSQAATQSVLLDSRRRCALCWGINHDLGPKEIQIAHIDRNQNNNTLENLAALCLPHHNEYDTIYRQTKNFTPEELREYVSQLRAILKKKESNVLAKYLGGLADSSQLVSTTADRLGEIVEAFEADSRRSNPNGLHLLQLFELYAKIGDFVAAQESFQHLLHIFDKKSPSNSDVVPGYSYLGGGSMVPVASPLVSVVKALAYASTLDHGFFAGLHRLCSFTVLYGTASGFKGLDARSIPHRSIDVVVRCYVALICGRPVEIANWAGSAMVEHLGYLLRGYVASLALKATLFQRDIKIRVCNQFGQRIRPQNDAGIFACEPGLAEIDIDSLPPNEFYRVVTDIACLPEKHLLKIYELLAKPPIDLMPCLKAGSPSMIYDELRKLLQVWMTYPGDVGFGDFIVEQDRLGELVGHMGKLHEDVSKALLATKKNISDERQLLMENKVTRS
jgi:hypothetical protein